MNKEKINELVEQYGGASDVEEAIYLVRDMMAYAIEEVEESEPEAFNTINGMKHSLYHILDLLDHLE